MPCPMVGGMDGVLPWLTTGLAVLVLATGPASRVVCALTGREVMGFGELDAARVVGR